ncbi:MAG: hypothetical protein ACOYXT_17090 [Bacteroidota bacterium]
MKTLLTILFLISFNFIYAQSFSQEDMVGEWSCDSVTVLDVPMDAKEKPAFEVLKKGFVNSKFSFKSDGLFTLQFPKESPSVLDGLKFVNNKKWLFDAKTSAVIIGPPNENLMQIFVKSTGGSVFFILADTPLLLKMSKMK